MKIVVIGAGGVLGAALVKLLSAERHQVVGDSRTSGVDLAVPAALAPALSALAPFDALVCVGPGTPLRPFAELTAAQLADDVTGKLFGQVEALRAAVGLLPDGGVVVLTGGARPELVGGVGGSTVNAALEAFVEAARRELPAGVRAHVVAPGWVAESVPPGMDVPASIPAATVAMTYLRALTDPAAPAVLTAG